eukprot:174675-Rhodomonas_salina.1
MRSGDPWGEEARRGAAVNRSFLSASTVTASATSRDFGAGATWGGEATLGGEERAARRLECCATLRRGRGCAKGHCTRCERLRAASGFRLHDGQQCREKWRQTCERLRARARYSVGAVSSMILSQCAIQVLREG